MVLVGLVTYDLLFFLRIGTREVYVGGMTPHPNERWMVQVARNLTIANWGILSPGQYLIHDRDSTYCPAFQHLIMPMRNAECARAKRKCCHG
jgi:hypothetical protein